MKNADRQLPPSLPPSTSHRPSMLSPPPSRRTLFFAFLMLGLISFGGALPHVRRIVVEERRWIDEDTFTELLGLCQFLPGGNAINLSVAIGMRFHGVSGALAGLVGLIACPSLIVLLLGIFYERTQHYPPVAHLFNGLSAAAAGLLVAMSVKLLLPLRKKPVAAIIAALAFIAIALLRFPLLPTMLALTTLSMAAGVLLRKKGAGNE